MSGVALIAGIAWLVIGLSLRRYAINHAKQFDYSPAITYDSSFWLAGSAIAFAVVIFSEIWP